MKKESFYHEWDYEADEGMVTATVTGTIQRGHPGSFYTQNGDPGDAPEGDEVEIISIVCINDRGDEVDFDWSLEDDLIDAILENC